jgi:hypothetical protein
MVWPALSLLLLLILAFCLFLIRLFCFAFGTHVRKRTTSRTECLPKSSIIKFSRIKITAIKFC